MPSEKKYGKSFGDLNSLKKNFFENNDGMLKMADEMADILNSQPIRTTCKACGSTLPAELFHSHNIGYIKCDKCGHLNSDHEDTDEFASKVYVEDDYSKNYSSKDRAEYEKRMNMIYVPKAEFLMDCLQKDGIEPSSCEILDIGAGCGYFVAASRKLGMNANGIEVSGSEVEYGNSMSDTPLLTHVGLHDSIDYIAKTNCKIVSAIGVLEHLINLKENLDAIKNNSNIKYLYASVPMFSFSCAFEASHQKCYNRHTGGTHTHLFTNESIEYLANEMGFEVAYEWRFGSDINDLYRFIMVSLQQEGNPEFASYFSDKFTPLMDDLQLILDKSEFSSELHFVLRRK